MDDLTEQLDRLSPKKRALFELLMKQQQAGIRPRRAQLAAYPLASAQQQLWFLDQLDPGSAAYNISFSLPLDGPIDGHTLERSLQTVARRHEILRTTFHVVDGQPAQVIADEPSVALVQIDLRGLPAAADHAEAQRLASEELLRPFDLERGPLLRATLLHMVGGQILLLTIHHIICDNRSIGILTDELQQVYAALARQQPARLPALPIQYADYALWQQQRLQGDTLERHFAYWTTHLGGTLPVLNLPTDRPRPPAQTYAGANLVQQLPAELTRELKALTRTAKVTLFMTMLAAVQTLLYHYTDQHDLLVGVPVSGRNYEALEGLIGFFVNTVVLRTDLAGNPTFLELLERVRSVLQAALAHQDLPFELLVAKLHPQRDMSRNPLFQVMFSLETNSNQSVLSPGVSGGTSKFDLSGVSGGTSKFDLSVDIVDGGEQMTVYWEYSTDLFDAATIKRMQAHFMVLLAGVVARPSQRIGWLTILTEAERRQVVTEWSTDQAEPPPRRCVHELFAAQARNAPGRIAVSGLATVDGVSVTQHLTYGELEAQANRLAHHLAACGILPGARVGICIERTPMMIVAVLAVLKAGATYVPLDADYPVARLRHMIEDAQLALVLTQQHLRPLFWAEGPPVLCLDQLEDTLAALPSTPPQRQVPPESIAYIIYTSGSTGQPKGVMVAHHSLANAYVAWEQAYHLTSRVSAHLQMASFSFDVFAGDLVRALCSGARLVLCPRELLLDPEQLYGYMREQQVDGAEFVPAVIRQLVQYLVRAGRSLDFMRLLAVGSDSWLGHELRLVQSVCGPQTRLVNSYGVSEATIDSSYFDGSSAASADDQQVAIGRPFPNTRLYVLGRQLQPLPVGIPGELYIGGPGLAYGYIRQPAQTAERFIPDPLADGPGQRLYKTGDQASWRPDGNLQLLGRIDQEVKIRGFRIHLAEIESALGQHPAVQHCAVIAREDGAWGQQIIAYVILRAGQAAESAQLASFLRQRLPSSMIPSAFVTLDSFPLTPNGKVDRAALPAPADARPADGVTAPRTATERAIAEIWQRLLGIAQLGVDQNFFDIGGHSLLASQLALQLREVFQVPFQIRSLFTAPTIAELALVIESLQRGEDRPDHLAIQVDLAAEARLDPGIPIAVRAAAYPTDPATVLVTGSTGFVGAFLLAELLRRTSARVYALIRADDMDSARQRLWANLAAYELRLEEYAARVIPICGDIARAGLGLAESDYDALAQQVDLIYHCATWVNFTYPYAMLQPTNVLGTRELIRFAGHTRSKPLHVVSTLSVFPSDAAPGEVIAETPPPDRPAGLVNGYAESKWVAEKLLWAAGERGLPVALYRPGLIGGDSQSGQGNPRDLIWHLIKGCVQMGSAPQINLTVDLAPVDYVCRALVHLSLQHSAPGKAFHLCNPYPLVWGQVVAELQRFGYRLHHIPYDRWRDELEQAVIANADHALRPFLSLFPWEGASDQPHSDQPYSDQPHVDAHNTLAGLAGTPIVCPALDSQLMSIYLARLVACGFLEPV